MRNHSLPSDLGASLGRDDFLRWFLATDLESDASVGQLLERTGRDFGGICVWVLPDRTVRLWAPPDRPHDMREVRRRAAIHEKRSEPVEILDSTMIPPGNEGPNAAWTLQEPVSRSRIHRLLRPHSRLPPRRRTVVR